jgi:formiminotetrahydrofolate cyclodeaminase
VRPLADRSLAQLLDDVAARTPAPGGGSSCGLVCALSAGLVEMAAAFALDRGEDDERFAEMLARAQQLRADALALAEGELHAYGAVLEALGLPDAAPDRAERIDAALSDATDSPLAIARAGAEVARLAAEVARLGNPRLRGDALTAELLADAACAAAVQLAMINLAGRPDDPRREEARELGRRRRPAAPSPGREV